MYNFFRKYQKQTMAFFMVVLMVAFIIPTRFGSMQGPEDQIIGKVGSDKVTRTEVRSAEDQWSAVKLIAQHVHPTGEEQWQPVFASLPPQLIADLQTKPEKLYLLEYEARKMGLTPDLSAAEDLLTNQNIGIRMNDGSVVRYENIPEDRRNGLRFSTANMTMVLEAFQRAADAVKVSQPLSKHELASALQKIKVRVVDFPAKDYDAKVPNPTADQLKQQFDRYSEFEADALPTETNPFGIGYKYPNRVKLQYLAIPRTEVRKAVAASKDDYSWDVEANRFYLKHIEEFPTTQAATEQFSLVRPSTQPTTKPFDEVHKQILDKLIEPQVDKLQRQIQIEIASRLNQDYEAFHKSGPTTMPAFDTFEYLQNLALQIQNKYHVTLTAASIGDSFKTSRDLRALSGIGQVSQFPDYATVAVDAFMPAAERDNPNVLHLFQPATPSKNNETAGDVYIFRITAADPAHKPASISEVQDQVEHDWRRLQAFDMAKADAQKLLDAAKTVGVESAAGNRTVI